MELWKIPTKKLKNLTVQKERIITFNNIILTLLVLCSTFIVGIIFLAFHFESQNIIMVFVISVLLACSITDGYLYGLIVSIMNVLFFFVFLFILQSGFIFNLSEFIMMIFTMLMVLLIISTLKRHLKRQTKTAIVLKNRSDILYSINKKVLATRDISKIMNIATEIIADIFECSVIFYLNEPKDNGYTIQSKNDRDKELLVNSVQTEIARAVYFSKKYQMDSPDFSPETVMYYLPIVFRKKSLGVIGIVYTNRTRLSPDNIAFLFVMIDQIAMAIQLKYVGDEQSKIELQAKKNEIHSNLLRGIAHDIRTPLTSILGTTALILEKDQLLNEKSRKKLLVEIYEESQWLNRVVANLISITRLSNKNIDLNKEDEIPEEIIAGAIRRVNKRFTERKIIVNSPNEIFFIHVDGVLISEVIINLVENAIKNSDDNSIITINLYDVNNEAVFEIIDEGSGLNKERLENLFSDYALEKIENPDISRGMGIGLRICKSIVEVHGGKIIGFNNEKRGATFKFTIPIARG